MRGTPWVLLGLVAVACHHGEDGPWPGLVATTDLPAGDADCPDGGSRVDIGADDGDPSGTAGDGTLQDGEIDASAVACNGPSVHDMLAATTALPEGDDTCALGGTHVDWGTDDGEPSGIADDAVLQDGEIEGSEDLCIDAPGGMLIVVSSLGFGDADCPSGGHSVSYGLDDGAPGGTADDGILDPDEVDGVRLDCVTDPADVFTPWATTASGTHSWIATGGDSTTLAGTGGHIGVAIYGGPLASQIVLRQDGDLDTAIPAPAPVVDLGANGVEVTESVTLPMYDGGGTVPATLHLRQGNDLGDQIDLAVPYVGDTRVTGLHVLPGVTLTLERTGFREGGLALEADLFNEGTILVESDGSGVGSDLGITCDDLINAATGVLDSRGTNYSGDLLIQTTGDVWQLGSLHSEGPDAATDGHAGDLFVVAGGSLHEHGLVDATGGTVDGGQGAQGGTIWLVAANGAVEIAGTVDASGGDGSTAGGGGEIFVATPLDDKVRDDGDLEEFVVPLGGPGSYVQSGSLRADGGTSIEDGPGGYGGSIVVDVRGGDVRVGGDLSARGGASAGGQGGQGGGVRLLATPLVWGAGVYVPELLGVEADLEVTGGAGVGGEGGAGGQIQVALDVTLTEESGGSSLVTRADDQVMSPATLVGRPPVSIVLLGLGGGLDVEGGEPRGPGGSVTVRDDVCLGPYSCTIPRVGARQVTSDVGITAAAGAGGSGGYVELRVASDTNQLLAISDVARIESRGLVDVSGGDGAEASNGQAGAITIANDAGDVEIEQGLVAASGACDACPGDGNGGAVHLVGYAVRQDATIDLGGDGFGSGGALDVRAWSFTSTAPIAARGTDVTGTGSGGGSGGSITIEASGPVDLRAPIDLDGGYPGDGDFLGRGGSLEVHADTVTITGDISARSPAIADPCVAASYGGEVDITGTGSVAVDADIAVDGGACTGAAGSTGGYIGIFGAQATASGALTARGGDAVDNSAATGGIIELSGDLSGSADASGGNATGTSALVGGDGGTVLVGGDNTGCVRAAGGTPGGVSGTIAIGGADTGTCP